MKSYQKQFAEMLGGKWEYKPATGQWHCDDGRYIARVHTGGVTENGEAAPGYGYFVFEDGKGKRIYPRLRV